jgi:hypothetical protein
MGRINQYPLDAEVNFNDKLLGSDAGQFVTKNFSIQQLFTFFQQNLAIETEDFLIIEDHEARLDEIETEFTITNSDITGLSATSVIKSYVDTQISGVSQITTDQANKIEESHGWGNHASAGYLTSETDPNVPSHVKSISTTDISGWDSAYTNMITGIDITENEDGSVKTVTLLRANTDSNLSDNFIDISEVGTGGITDTNYYLSSASLDESGILQLGVTGASNFQVNFDSRYYTESEIDGFNYVDLTDFSITTTAASGGGALSYNNSSGVFTFTPATFSGTYLPLSGGTMTGMIEFSGANGVAGDIYADNKQTKLLNNGTTSGSTYQEDSWFRGDLYHQGGALELSIGDTTNGPVFQRGLNITTNLDVGGDLDLTQSSTIVFDRGVNQTSITKVDVSNFKSAYGSWVRNIEYLTGDGTAVTFTDLNSATANADSIDIKLKGETTDDDRTLSNRIYGSKYIDLTADTNNNYYSISVDIAELNNTNDARYVEVTGDTMTGTLTVSGAASFIEGKAKTDLYKNDGNTVILDRQNEWFKGDLRGGDLQDSSGTNIFTSSTSTFANSITIVGDSITLGSSQISLSSSELSNIKNNVVESIKFAKVTGSEEIRLVIDNPTAIDLNSQTVLKAGAYINITEDDNTPANPIIAADTTSPNGLATQSYVTSALSNVVTGISLDDGQGIADTATSGTFTLIPGSNISIERDGTNTNNITFAFDNSSNTYLTTTAGNNAYVQNSTFTSNGLMRRTNASTYDTIDDNSTNWDAAHGWGNHADAGYLELAANQTLTAGHIAQFDSSGNIEIVSFSSKLPSTVVQTSSSADFQTNTITAGDFILSSDRDLKENIIPLAERKIDVDFKEYNFKGSKRTRFGVIAQELEEKHPEFIHTRESGEKSVSYIDLLVAKVHELENRIKDLENGSTRDR